MKDIGPGPSSSSVTPNIVVSGDGVYFIVGYRQLWKSDGSSDGTILLKDFMGGGPILMGKAGSILMLGVSDASTGRELWKNDGTVGDASLVKDINTGAGSSDPQQQVRVGSTLFFTAYRPDIGRELWKSDGTESGTVLVKDIVTGPGSSFALPIADVNGTLVFRASKPETGTELWRSDGTEAGTTPMNEIVPGPGSTSFGRLDAFEVVGNALVFVADDGVHGFEPWRSDAVTVSLLMDVNPGPASSLPKDGNLPSQLSGVASGLMLFAPDDGAHGFELWATDGWNTRRIADIIPGGAGSGPFGFAASGPLIFFTANDARVGSELWTIARAAVLRAFNLPDTGDASLPRAPSWSDGASNDGGVLSDPVFDTFELRLASEID